MLHDGRISWASRKDKNVNDGNSYLLKSRNGKRKRNMVDVLSFDARETKDTKNDSLYKTLRLFDLSYSVFARLEWLGIPETKSIPISVKDKSLRMPEGNVAVTCVEGCEREAEGMRGTLKDVGVPSGGKVDVRIVVIHDAEHYKAQVRSEGDAGDAQGMQDSYRGIGRSVATQCVTAETWLVVDGKRSDSMRRSVMATALNELRIKQEVAAGLRTMRPCMGISLPFRARRRTAGRVRTVRLVAGMCICIFVAMGDSSITVEADSRLSI